MTCVLGRESRFSALQEDGECLGLHTTRGTVLASTEWESSTGLSAVGARVVCHEDMDESTHGWFQALWMLSLLSSHPPCTSNHPPRNFRDPACRQCPLSGREARESRGRGRNGHVSSPVGSSVSPAALTQPLHSFMLVPPDHSLALTASFINSPVISYKHSGLIPRVLGDEVIHSPFIKTTP